MAESPAAGFIFCPSGCFSFSQMHKRLLENTFFGNILTQKRRLDILCSLKS